ncbi:uncharacterized protein UTRI_03918_B [Ustilago trichophora]|uniref:Uncharacterized protein n=1 Tax=Ustilago trichophora TaxID=86804 RepID=A0A5C3EAS7_9BASI|nr:uncharacterized protein UTRI_03918_B [Ustilago trichophora]
MSRAPPLMPSSSSGHSYSSPKLGAAAIYSTSSPTGSPRPYFAQHLPGTLSPYRDASARYAHLGSPRISSLSRDATAALKGSNYPTSSSRPTSPTPRSRSPSPSSDSAESSASSSRASRAPVDDQAQLDDRPLLTRSDSSSRRDVPPQPADNDDSAPGPGPNIDSPSGLKRVHQLQPIDTKSPAVTGPAVTGPAVTGPAVTGPAVTGPAVTGPDPFEALRGHRDSQTQCLAIGVIANTPKALLNRSTRET